MKDMNMDIELSESKTISEVERNTHIENNVLMIIQMAIIMLFLTIYKSAQLIKDGCIRELSM